MKAGIVFFTDDLAAVWIAVVEYCRTLVGHHLLTALFIQCVRSVPQLLGNDGRYGWVWVHNPLVFIQENFAFAALVDGLAFVGTVPALIFGVAENMPDGQHIEGIPFPAGKALI